LLEFEVRCKVRPSNTDKRLHLLCRVLGRLAPLLAGVDGSLVSMSRALRVLDTDDIGLEIKPFQPKLESEKQRATHRPRKAR